MARAREGPRPFRPTVTRHFSPDGRRCPAGTPGAKKVTQKSRTYYADLPRPGQRPERVSLGATSYEAAVVELGRLLECRRLDALGLTNPAERHALTGLDDHVAAWVASLEAAQTSAKQVRQLRARVLKLAGLAGWKRLPDVTLSSAQVALGALLRERHPTMPVKHQGRSAQTRNHYHAALRQFLLWCQADRRINAYPLAALDMLNVETDRRHDRRCPGDEEIGALTAYLLGPDAKVRMGMAGPTRLVGYHVCMAVGYRAGELSSLTVSAFDLDARTVTVEAGYSKRRRRDTLELPAWLALELTPFLAGRKADERPWSGFPPAHPGRLLKADLAACGVPYELGGLFWDMHSFRAWYITALANQPGIDPRTLMELARHSTPTLTLKVYAKAQRQRTRAAAEAIPDPRARLQQGCSAAPDRAEHSCTDVDDGGWGPDCDRAEGPGAQPPAMDDIGRRKG